MKTKSLLICSLLLVHCFNGNLLAQDNTKAIASITYEFVHVKDTNNRAEPLKEEMIAYLGQNSSVYKSLTAHNRNLAVMEKMKNNPMMSISGLKVEELYVLPEGQIVRTGALSRTDYLIESKMTPIDWQIGNETKEIEGFICQNAKGDFGGRQYTVWFAPELPFSAGPWKLHGLPGLILEAEDSKRDVIFNFIAFEKADESDVSVVPPKGGVKTSEKEFEKARIASQNNPFGGTAMPKSITVPKPGGGAESITVEEYKIRQEIRRKEQEAKNNNPLELKVN